ncbi:LysR family transcriptional regulator [Pseudonocardia ailaonensis]|uniref:LysR family transcriptional regulator n=1 Tax=Pseudonocardia ailaonensis TaxID=367279 RepID=A0ABN2N7G8_9PSEU
MNRVLDVVALRSLVAVADCGGFHRAAASLHVSQPTVSHHVRRLEAVCGQPLVRREGRVSRFTPAGETLVVQARRILALHDETLHTLATGPAGPDPELVVGSTEHAADQLLPRLTPALGGRVRYRLDRGSNLRAALDRGDIDLALLMGPAPDERSADAGLLDVHWYAAPGWSVPTGGAVPLVALDEPCALRDRALATLAKAERQVTVACEAAYLAGVLAAARAGLGVALLATMGHAPEGLVRRDDLPLPEPLTMSVRSRRGFGRRRLTEAASAVSALLAPVPESA